MNHNLKALGLALVAAFAMSAVVASGAQAAEFTSFNTHSTPPQHEHTIVYGVGVNHVFTAAGGSAVGVICGYAIFEGTSATGTGATQTIQPRYEPCEDTEGRIAHVNMGGCDYVFHIGKKIAADEWEGTADINCPANQDITVTITSFGVTICTVTVQAQNGIGPIFYENMTASIPPDITIKAKATNVINTTTGGFFNCGAFNGQHKNGTYTGNTTITGENTAEELIDLTIL